MKTIMGAIALVVAAPAAAQSAGGHDAHSEPRQTGQQEDAGHHHGHEGHGEHKMERCKDRCDKEERQEGQEDCCLAHQESGVVEQDHSAHNH